MKLQNTTFQHSQHWVGSLIGALGGIASTAINAASSKNAPTDKYANDGHVNSGYDGNLLDVLINGADLKERNWNQTLPDGSTNKVQPGISTGYDSLDAQYLANQEDYALQNYYSNLQSDRNLSNQLSLIQNASAAEKLGYQNAGISTANLTSGSTALESSAAFGICALVS